LEIIILRLVNSASAYAKIQLFLPSEQGAAASREDGDVGYRWEMQEIFVFWSEQNKGFAHAA